MRYLDVCAGISASSVAWKPLGWEAAGYSEIEAAPRAILEHRQGVVPVGWDHHHAPGSNITPLFGDFTQIEAHHVGPIDLLVGGTPCQDFSIAGLRAGMDGDRGNLSLEFLRLADRTRPRWLVWENVPGVLSIDGGRAFGSILGGMGELGYGFAYRVLDAQHFGVPQRRRRVFVVGYLGDHRRASAVLFERHSLSGHPAPRREKGEIAPTIPSLSLGGGGLGTDFDCDGGLIQACGGNNCSGPVDVACALQSHGGPHGRQDFASETFISHALRGEGFDASEDGTGRGTPLVPVAFDTTQITSAANYSNPQPGDPCHPLAAGAHPPAIHFNSREELCHSEAVFGSLGSSSPQAAAVAFDMRGREGGAQFEGPHDTANIRAANGGSSRSYVAASAVRRLTPRECERLQGFPDDYTLVSNRGKPMADGPRYKALGNSMAVPVMHFIGQRIAAVEAIAAPP